MTIFKKGQTLTALLVFMAVAATITAGAVTIIISGSQAADKLQQGSTALQIAESAGENAILRILRNPNYTGENMSIGVGGSAAITVSGTTTKTINITGKYGNFVRKLRINAGYSAGILQITPPWTEVYP